jgi:hypothetical protein
MPAQDVTVQDMPVNVLPGQDRPVQGVLQGMMTKGRGFVPFCLCGGGFMAFAHRCCADQRVMLSTGAGLWPYEQGKWTGNFAPICRDDEA